MLLADALVLELYTTVKICSKNKGNETFKQPRTDMNNKKPFYKNLKITEQTGKNLNNCGVC
jgi:hypothetical protein